MTVFTFDVRGKGLHSLFVGNVYDVDRDFDAEGSRGGRGFFEAFGVDIADGERGASLREANGGSASDAGGCAGDDGNGVSINVHIKNGSRKFLFTRS